MRPRNLLVWDIENAFLIILPQALKLVIPGIANTFLALVKDTPLILLLGCLSLRNGKFSKN